LCCFVGLFAAAVLSAGYLLDLPVPCGRSRGCQAVAMLPASRIYGLPIAYVGVGAWLLLLGLLTANHRSRRATQALVAASGVGAAISAALLIHAHTAIGATCLWCAASGIAMTLLFLFSLPLLRRPVPRPPLRPLMVWGMALACALATGAQAGAMGKAARKAPVAAGVLAKFSSEELSAGRGALGPVKAPLTVVMFGDLWCGSCRDSMDALRHFQAEHPRAVRVVYRHLPLWEIPGHQFSGTSAALAEIASEHGKFWQFIDELHRQPRPPGPAGFLSLLGGLGISPDGIEERLADPDDPAVARVRRDMDLAERLGMDSTPSFLILAEGQPALSSGPRQLPVLLESPVVQQLLLRSRP
jgi:protein-disulfide isomerase/uncharacterized membrane protein